MNEKEERGRRVKLKEKGKKVQPQRARLKLKNMASMWALWCLHECWLAQFQPGYWSQADSSSR